MFEKEINRLEKKWKADLHGFIKPLYHGHWLPSHNLNHHTRVWENACFLYKEFMQEKNFPEKNLLEQLMLSCYFHDIGLLENKSENHGINSRRICKIFLGLHAPKINFDISEVLHAIENHDNKDYGQTQVSDQTILLQLLSLADDIDAFGATGAYRYVEIYLLRNISTPEIPERILNNANARKNNLTKVLHANNINSFPKVNKSFNLINDLFEKTAYKSSPIRLVEFIEHRMVKPKNDPLAYLKSVELPKLNDDRTLSFATNFLRENSSSGKFTPYRPNIGS